MRVELDNVWATPSTLHGRVTVWADDGRWRSKHTVAVPLNGIPEEAIAPLVAYFAEPARDPAVWDVPLF